MDTDLDRWRASPSWSAAMCSTCHGTIVAERNRTDDHNLGPNSDGVHHILSWDFHIVCFGNYISVRPGSRSFLATIRDLLGIKTITLFKVMLWVPSGTLLVPREDLLGVFWSSPGALGEALVPTLVGPASQN